MNNRRTALVTGSASGIGLAIARQLIADGMRVMLVDRNEKVHEAADELSRSGGQAKAFVADLGQEQQVLAAADHAKQTFGRCDVLVNNAGVHPKNKGKPFLLPEIATADFEAVLRINLTAPFLLCRELMPLMKANGWGRVINTTSRAGRTFVGPVGIHYSASKAGLIGMTRQLAGEYASYGITVNCIAPGRIETPLSNTSSPEIIAAATAAIPARRLGVPEEIAAAAGFLASEGASYVTGTVIDVNGGAFIG